MSENLESRNDISDENITPTSKPVRSEKQKEAVRRWMRNNKDYCQKYQLHLYHKRMADPEKREQLREKSKLRYQKRMAEKRASLGKPEKMPKPDREKLPVGHPRKYPDGYDGSLWPMKKEEPIAIPEDVLSV